MDNRSEIKISEYDNNGKKIDYNVIMVYDSDVTGKRYVFYTDGKKDSKGNVGVRVGFVEEIDGNVNITSITNPIEQAMVAEIYAENTSKSKS